jgi:hypothetical protein
MKNLVATGTSLMSNQVVILGFTSKEEVEEVREKYRNIN